MTLENLITLLEEYRDEHGPDAEVRLMTQQSWPFENEITGLCSHAELHDDGEDEEDELYCEPCDTYFFSETKICARCGKKGKTEKECEDETESDDEEDAEIIYLVEGNQLGYGNKRAWEIARED